ncbi:hypothetical protein, partial [Nitratifractor sp.]
MQNPGNKEAMQIALEFFKGNYALNLGAAAILIVMALLKGVPLLGIFFAFAYPILSFAVQIYVAREAAGVERPEAMREVAGRTKLGDLFSRHLDIAAGGFLGLFLIMLLLLFLFAALIGSAVNLQAVSQGDLQSAVASAASSGTVVGMFLLMILMLWLGYVIPGVMGEVIFAESFTEAFRKSLLLFSPSFWKRTLNGAYFRLILIW